MMRGTGHERMPRPENAIACADTHRPYSSKLGGNLLQTLIEFEGPLDVALELRFGILGRATCRRRDVEDFEALGLKVGLLPDH